MNFSEDLSTANRNANQIARVQNTRHRPAVGVYPKPSVVADAKADRGEPARILTRNLHLGITIGSNLSHHDGRQVFHEAARSTLGYLPGDGWRRLLRQFYLPVFWRSALAGEDQGDWAGLASIGADLPRGFQLCRAGLRNPAQLGLAVSRRG